MNKEYFDLIRKVLFFSAKREDYEKFDNKLLLIGLCSTWLVGIGRWWDDPDAGIIQMLGVGSIAYILVLSSIIYVLLLFIRTKSLGYKNILTFVSITSIPGIVYAIPVEKIFDINKAIQINIIFLIIVALWRVVMYYLYLKRNFGLSTRKTNVIFLLPLTAIITTLQALNLHKYTFDVMGGLRREPSPHDGESVILMLLTGLSITLIIPLIIAYLVMIIFAWRERGKG